MIRALTILTASVALAVSAQPASASAGEVAIEGMTLAVGVGSFSVDIGTTEDAKARCYARGFMDYTDDSCMDR